jgi:DNA-binding MarR family transcriptional regulator
MADREINQPSIDKVIHERARLLILSYLAAGEHKKVPFLELKEKLDLTAGNLSIQLRNLEEAGYVKVEKRIVGRKTATDVKLTPAGMSALNEYLAEMEELIRSVKESRGVDRGNKR